MRHRVNLWFKVGVSAWSLGLEVWSVIAMRSLEIIAGGPQGEAEAQSDDQLIPSHQTVGVETSAADRERPSQADLGEQMIADNGQVS
jgi:hypothetical protein